MRSQQSLIILYIRLTSIDSTIFVFISEFCVDDYYLIPSDKSAIFTEKWNGYSEIMQREPSITDLVV